MQYQNYRPAVKPEPAKCDAMTAVRAQNTLSAAHFIAEFRDVLVINTALLDIKVKIQNTSSGAFTTMQ